MIELYINSKTNGRHLLRLDFNMYWRILRIPGFKGFCIQSTNTKHEGKNPTLYPCIYGKDPVNGKRYVKQIHRVILSCIPYGYVVDHINGNTFDNRLENLEVVTRAENVSRAQRNRKKNLMKK